MATEVMTDIIDKIDDLIVQATKERSHYYTANVLQAARLEILSLRRDLADERLRNRR